MSRVTAAVAALLLLVLSVGLAEATLLLLLLLFSSILRLYLVVQLGELEASLLQWVANDLGPVNVVRGKCLGDSVGHRIRIGEGWILGCQNDGHAVGIDLEPAHSN